MCAYMHMSVGVCSIGLSVAFSAVCVSRSCGSLCFCVFESMQYWPGCGVLSCLCVEELWPCGGVCLRVCVSMQQHRVDRVPGFFSSRPNWDPPRRRMCPLPLWFRGRGGGVVPIRTRPVCGEMSCLSVEELRECVLMCLWEYAVLGCLWRDELSVS